MTKPGKGTSPSRIDMVKTSTLYQLLPRSMLVFQSPAWHMRLQLRWVTVIWSSSHNSSLPPEGMAAFLTSGAPAAVFLEAGLVVSGVDTVCRCLGCLQF